MSKKKSRPPLYLELLNQMGRQALLDVCNIIGADTTRLIKGGITCKLTCEQLRGRIRQQVGHGLFPDRRKRLSQFLEEWMPSELDPILDNEPNPEQQVHDLLQDVRMALAQLEDSMLFELISGWIDNPQGREADYDHIDAIAEELGFSYEEIDEDFVLVNPSPLALSNNINAMSDSTFYHSVIALAGMALPKEKFSEPPGMLNDGYEFLQELAEYLRSIVVRLLVSELA